MTLDQQPATALEELRERLREAETQLAFERDCFAAANEEIKQLESHLLSGIDGSEESQVGRLRLLHDRLRRQFEQLKNRPHASTAELKRACAQRDALQQVNNGLVQRNHELATAIHAATVVERELRAHLETAQQKARENAERVTTSHTALHELNQRLMTLEEEKRCLAEERQKLTHELEELRAQASPIIDLRRQLVERFDALHAIISDVRALNTPVVAPFASEVQRVRNAITLLEAEHAPLRERNTDLDAEQRAHQAVARQCRIDLETCSKQEAPQHQHQLKLAESEYRRLSQEREAIQDRLILLERRRDLLQHRLDMYDALLEPIEVLLEPLPPFVPPSPVQTTEHEEVPAPVVEPTSPPQQRTPGQKAAETRARNRASRPPPELDTSVQEHRERPGRDSNPPPSPSNFNGLELAAKRYGVRVAGLVAVSLYRAIAPKLRLYPTVPELFAAARAAGIWMGSPINREEEVTDGVTPLHQSPLRQYLALYRHQGRTSYTYTQVRDPSWDTLVTTAQAEKLNTALQTLLKSS